MTRSGILLPEDALLRFLEHALPFTFLSAVVMQEKDADEKGRTLREVRRVLRPGGRLHLLDFARLESRQNGFLARWVHSSHPLKDNTEDRVLSLMSEAGLTDPTTLSNGTMFFTFRTTYYQAAGAERNGTP